MQPIIGELIDIKTGYTSFVNLEHDLYDSDENIGRMARYRPITSHRTAFEALSKSLQMKDGRCYLLTGAYGTGKSHLCLMFANYLQTPASVAPMPAFFANYAEADPHAANSLQSMRSQGSYLVALCDWGGKEDFDEVVLKAVDRALTREGFGTEFDTHYLAAVRKIETWVQRTDNRASRFCDDFEQELSDINSGMTINAFLQRLRNYDAEALQEFRRIHKLITMSDFVFDRANLIEILGDTLSSAAFKQRFLGMLVLFDEFGDRLERGHLSPKAFQRFAEFCAETPSSSGRMIFVATAHKSMTQYAKAYNEVDYKTASDRIKEVELVTDGVEEIISAIVVPQKQHPLWQEYIAPRTDVFDSLLADCNRLKLFTWLTGPKIRTKIIENIYPMHPMATFCLLKLARDVASNNRSVYTFFSKDEPGSYPEFVKGAPILQGGRLNLYTAERLYHYFASAMKAENKELRESVRDKIRDYENALRQLNRVLASETLESLQFRDDPLIPRLLRLLLIYEIVDIPNRLDNLKFGLYCVTSAESEELKNLLDTLVKRRVLYQAKDTMLFEFPRSDVKHLDSMIDDRVKDPELAYENAVTELNALVPLTKSDLYLAANNYNSQYAEDKQLLRRFVRAVDLGTITEQQNVFQILEAEIAATVTKKGDYEGIALYAVCETAEDIARAKEFCARNESGRIVVAIPKSPIPLQDAIMELKALQAIQKSDEYANFSTQDRSAFDARLNGDASRAGAKKSLANLRAKFLTGKEIVWHGKSAQALKLDENNPYAVADHLIAQLYQKRNTLVHDDFNKVHVKVDKNKPALKEAVDKLLHYTEPIVIRKDLPQARGDYRYLQNVLLNNDVLYSTKIDGYKESCAFASDSSKYASRLPYLSQLIQDVRALGEAEPLRISVLMEKYQRPPYGQGPVALALGLACLRNLLGDSIRFKVDSNAVGDMPLKTFEEVLMLVEGSLPNAFLSYRPLSEWERKLIEKVYSAFGEPGPAGKEYSLVEAQESLARWWQELSPVAKVVGIYPKNKPETAAFLSLMQQVSSKEPYSFLFDDLPGVFGYEANSQSTSEMVEAVSAGCTELKKRIESGPSLVEERIRKGIRTLFKIDQNTDSDIVEGVVQWYNDLDKHQQDLHANWHNNDSKPLLTLVKTITKLHQTFMVDLPKRQEYGFSAVKDWTTDRVAAYLTQLETGKQHIETNRITVAPPEMEIEPPAERTTENEIAFKGKFDVKFKGPFNGGCIYITEGSADPLDIEAQRHQYSAADPLIISKSKTLKYALLDQDGNWSPVSTVILTNAEAPYVPTIGIPDMLYETRLVQFKLKDAASMEVACRELFRQCLELGILDASTMEKIVMNALQEAQKKP